MHSAHCEKKDPAKILIISSYNPETNTASKTIEDFIAEYKDLDEDYIPLIENLNCRTFSEMHTWRDNLRAILKNYSSDETKPSLILLLGQEAWATYLSLSTNEILRDVPIMGSQVNRHIVKLSDTIPDSLIWEPKSVDVLTIAKDYNIVGGVLYEYDYKSNLKLLLHFYPDIENVAFVSDNSYGGIALASKAREVSQIYPNINFIHIDGRKETIYSGAEQIANLPPRTGILLGTWRVDKTGSYYIKKSLSMLRSDSNFPTFTLTGLGLESWAIGGYIPKYINQGVLMARKAQSFLNTPKNAETDNPMRYFTIIENGYSFNIDQLDPFNIDLSKFTEKYTLVNSEESFWRKYIKEILIICLIGLLFLAFTITFMVLYIRTRNYKKRLENYQKELRVARDKADESNRMKSSFLANMSHEIRTPLNAICGFAEVLSSDDVGNLESSDRKYISQIIQNNANLLLSLINGILDMSRIESGKMKYYNEEFDWVSLCKDALFTVKTATQSDVEFIFKSKHSHYYMTADKQLMTQILINLLNNATKFTKEGSITLEVTGNDKYVTVSVADTGIGIPLEKQKNIFEQFYKLNERSQGTGLGLALCKKIIERYNGMIWVDNEYTDGAKIVFTIPTELKDEQ